jgi:nitrite reductase/ring-hydroxylating ferredoxin subunit
MNDWSHLRGDSKRIGTVHAILNSVGLGLNVASLALRRSGRRDTARALSGIAYAGALFSAHLGGQLSFGLGVRVNRTAWESPPDEFRAVMAADELGDELRRVEVDGVAVAVTRSRRTGEPCAIAATCTHLGGPLDEGTREGDSIVCPWHGSQFDLCTGDVEHGPAVFPEPRYEARIREGQVEIRAVERR